MKGQVIQYSAEELAWIEARKADPRKVAHAEFCAAFVRTDVSLSNFNALCKRKGWLTGRTGRYVPGQIPLNKGQPMPFNANSARTQFQKGNVPHTYRGPGHERIDATDGYVILVLDEPNPHTGGRTRPVHKHRHLWEKLYGPVPDGIWSFRQGKTQTEMVIPLHPVMLAIVDAHRVSMRDRAIIDPERPVFANSRGKPWGLGFGASWAKELVRLKLHAVEPRLTFHGLRTTNATMIASAVAKNPKLYGGIDHVKSQLGHLSDKMAKHYARRAQMESMNGETILLIPTFGNQIP